MKNIIKGGLGKFLLAVSVLSGSIIGVGIFGLPFAFAKAGFLTGFLFLAVITVVMVVLNLAFGEIILRTNQPHQLVGYADIYLGKIWRNVTLFACLIGMYSAILAYIIVGGEFLSNILSWKFSFSPSSLGFVFFAAAALMVISRLKTVAKMDFLMAAFYLTATVIIFIWSADKINLGNFAVFNKDFWFLPYGVILFAMAGSSIALQREVLDGREHQFKKAIIWGTLFPAVIYLLFSLSVVGVAGEDTSPEALSGLLAFLRPKIVILGSVFGVLAIFTSFVNVGKVLQEIFWYDFKLKKTLAWFLTLFPPLALFFLGVRNFINVIFLAGAVAIGLSYISLILIYGKVKTAGHRIPEFSLNFSRFFWYLMMALMAVGVVYALIK